MDPTPPSRTVALLRWADATRDLEVHARLDSPLDVPAALRAGADGVELVADHLQLASDPRGELVAELLERLAGRPMLVTGLAAVGGPVDVRLTALLGAVEAADRGGLPVRVVLALEVEPGTDPVAVVRAVAALRARIVAVLGDRCAHRAAIVSRVGDVLRAEPERVPAARGADGWAATATRTLHRIEVERLPAGIAAAHGAGADGVLVPLRALADARVLAARATGTRLPRAVRRA